MEKKVEDDCKQPDVIIVDHTMGEGASCTEECDSEKPDDKGDEYDLLMMWLEFPYYAVIHDRRDLVELCIKTGYDMNLFRGLQRNRSSLLHAAVSKPKLNIEMIDTLLKHISVDIGLETQSALLEGIFNSNITEEEILSLIIRFVEAGADIGPSNELQITVIDSYVGHLRDCIMSGNASHLENGTWMQIIDILSKSYLNKRDVFGRTPLHWLFAPDSSQTEQWITVMDYLLQKGAKVSNLDVNENSMLHAAVGSLNLDIVKYAITRKCPVNQLSLVGLSPLHEVCLVNTYSNEECDNLLLPILEVLVSAGAEINAQAVDGTTVLHHCVHALNGSVCEFLIKHGASVTTADYLSRTPIHSAVRNGNEHVTNILMQYGANINAQDKYGYTALHYAAMYGITNAVRSFLECGADVLSKCFVNELQPLHVAAERGDIEMIKLLVEAGAKVNGKDMYGATPLHYAGFDGMPDITESLLKCGAGMESCDQLAQTPLTLALKMGRFKVAQLLTNDQNEIRFGQLLSFPNRPAISSDDIKSHFAGMTEELVSIGKAVDISKSILSTPGLMRIDITRGENKTIHEQITSLAHAVASRIGELDSRFKGSIFPTGSISDGCKVGYPNEFDYLLNLDLMEECIEDFARGPTGFVQLHLKPEKLSYVSEFLNQNHSLDSFRVYEYFRKLVVKASFDVHRHDFTRLQCGYNTIAASYQFLTISRLATHTKLMPSVLTWRGAEYKGMEISFDINPVMKYNNWPTESIKTSTLLTELQRHQMYLFPKSYLTNLNKVPLLDSIQPEALWCYSFVHIEKKIFQNFTEPLKNAFSLCKSLRMQPIIPAFIRKPAPVRDDDFIFPDDMSVSGCVTEDARSNCDQEDVDSMSLNASVEQSAFDAHNDAVSSGHSESNADDDMGVTYESELKTLYDDDEQEEEEDDIKGETCISSYHLKHIFLYEVEKIPIERKSDKNLTQLIPYRVYKELLKCYENKMVPSFFTPKQNMFGGMTPESQVDTLRLSMCEHVVAMLDKLGFGDDD